MNNFLLKMIKKYIIIVLIIIKTIKQYLLKNNSMLLCEDIKLNPLNPGQQDNYVIYSSIVSLVIEILIGFLSYTDKNIYQIRQLEEYDPVKIKKMIKAIKIILNLNSMLLIEIIIFF